MIRHEIRNTWYTCLPILYVVNMLGGSTPFQGVTLWSLRIIGRTVDFYLFFFFSQGLLVRLAYVTIWSRIWPNSWRKHVACTDVFESLLEAIATFWPPELQM